MITCGFFDAARDGKLVLQSCPRDGVFYYPRSRCPKCWKDDWSWQPLSGRGTVHAFTIDRIGHDQAQAARVPFAIGLVDLEEGARVVGNVVGCEVDDVRVGLEVEACFETVEGVALLQFRPRT